MKEYLNVEQALEELKNGKSIYECNTFSESLIESDPESIHWMWCLIGEQVRPNRFRRNNDE
jgi:hypothetical protein